MAGVQYLKQRDTMARYIFVVSREHRQLYEHLVQQFGDDLNVRVILDRRHGDRRRRDSRHPASATERRWRLDRRKRPSADEELKFRSHTIITLAD